jgi:ABC-type lipoprotein export system ATPase subunit/GNAT superfamily N-acetyltransferase
MEIPALRRRWEYFRIKKFRRVYDKAASKFSFYVAYETATQLTPRTVVVAEAFGLGLDQEQKFEVLDTELKIGPQDIVYVTGDSGSGKSILLKAIKKDLGDEAIDMADIHVEPSKPLIETVGKTVEEGLELLSRVGLNDAFLFLRTYDQLSDGQKYRYRIAKLIESGKKWWLMDEFVATLDRDTAKIVAFNLQKVARAMGKAVIVATTHLDLFDDLKPSVHVHKRFGKEICVVYYTNEGPSECSLVKEMTVEGGTRDDWRRLEQFHYRSHNLGVSREIYSLRRKGELCGVIVYNYPPIGCSGRNLVLPGISSVKMLNRMLSTISRVVVHPKYRSVGLGAKLVRDTLARIGTPCVEMIAVMAKYNPFAEKAGMKRVIFQVPGKEALKIADALEGFGFNLKLIGSTSYNLQCLEKLKPKQISTLKEVFIKNDHPRLAKEIVTHRGETPYGSKKAYVEAMNGLELPRMAKLIRVVGMLLQVKAYLFWQRPSSA